MKKKMKQSTLMLILNGVSILALLFMAFCLFCYSRVNHKVDTANSERYELTYNANRFMNGSSYLTNEVRAYAATGKQEHYDNYWNEVNNLKNRDIGIEKLKAIGITESEQSMIDEMSGLSNQLVPLEENAMQDAAAGDKTSAIQYVYGTEYNTSIAKINQLKSSFLEQLDQRALGEVNRLIGVSRIILACFVIALILVIVLQGLTYWIIKSRLLIPIIKIKDEMGEIAEGNLSSDFDIEPDTSEIGLLVNSIYNTKSELKKYIKDIAQKLSRIADGDMNQTITLEYLGEFLPIRKSLISILDALNDTLSQINDSANEVAASSSNVASTSQAVSQGSTQQAAATEELSASADAVYTKLEYIVENTNIAKACSLEARDKLIQGTEQMSQLSESLNVISGSSTQISGIIKTIEDIAFQTNILALNAAVEAARAGEAGKGFAVVADEVRNLAAKSSQAAKDTTKLIENTLSLVEKGVLLAVNTMETFHEVGNGAETSTGLVEEIATASVEQQETLKQFTASIHQISNVVQANVATAEESSAASLELSGQAENLKHAVGHFRLRANK